MGFRIRGSDTILQRLIAWVSTGTDKITDYNIGSATRTLLESVALQVEEYYYDLQKAVEFAIKNSGFHAFGFTRESARKANGIVTITFNNPLATDMVIPKGTNFNTGNTRSRVINFTSTENIKIMAGTQVINIPVECTEIGEIGNVYAGEITKLAIGNPYVKHISNTQAFINGKDRETEINRELRFREYVHTLQRATADSLAYGIKLVPGVAGVSIDDNYIGWVFAYVHDQNGDLPNDLKELVNRKLIDYRSAGIEVSVRPVIKKFVDLNIDIKYRDGIDEDIYNEMVRELVIKYINTRPAALDLNMSNLVTAINDTYRDIIAHINICENSDVRVLKNEIVKANEIVINGYAGDEIGV